MSPVKDRPCRLHAAVLAVALVCGPAAAQETPYAGFDARDIASLSEADVAAILAGEGWGLALPAELNGYPGPAHVLELADALNLTGRQQAEIQIIFDAMRAEAQDAGRAYVAAERHLSMMFGMGHAEADRLDMLLASSAAALARLRAVHLKAHLAVTPLLTDDQKQTYQDLRGYGAGADHGGHTGHVGHGGQ
jgi:hypothetical protein